MSEGTESGALVAWTSRGLVVSFTVDQIAPPSSIDQLAPPSKAAFFRKQWPVVASYFYHRLHHEEKLHTMTLPNIIDKVYEEIERRWEKRRIDKRAGKKRRRIESAIGGLVECRRTKEDAPGSAAEAAPPTCVLATNFLSFDLYEQNKTESDAVIDVIVREFAACGEIIDKEVIVQEDLLEALNVDAPDHRAAAVTPEIFDPRVQILLRFASPSAAIEAVVKLHNRAIDGRRLQCKIIKLEE
jgi:hypothetical protein